jgi:hypothetical protein
MQSCQPCEFCIIDGPFCYHENIEVDKPIEQAAFARTIPEGYRMVATLPALENLAAASAGNAPEFTVTPANGQRVSLSSLKGKVVLLNFFFNT